MSAASEVCRAFRNTGNCKYGAECKYAHSEGEPIANPPRGPCFNFQQNNGSCQFAERCRFKHGDNDTRFNKSEEAKGAAAPRQKREEKKAKTSTAEKIDEVCENYLKGKCRFGDNCRRIHQGTIEQSNVEPKVAKRRQRRRRSRGPRSESTSAAPTEQQQQKSDEVCKNFLAGRCKNGDKCTRQHPAGHVAPTPKPAGEAKAAQGDKKEKRTRTRKPRTREPNEEVKKIDEVCRNYSEGKCRYGEYCRRQHEGNVPQRPVEKKDEECNNFKQGRCRYGDACSRRHTA